MGGSQKSKRVTWPSDDNLCQVKLFLTEDSPAQVGFASQDHLQAKTWPTHSNSFVSNDNLPPGFEGMQPANQLWNKLPQIPLIKWRCPSSFVLDEAWSVAAGEESVEVKIESDRVKKVLEAIYPRESAIPPDPSGVVGLGDYFPNDKPPILIPITPIEDEDAATPADGIFVDSAVMNAPMSSQPQPPAASVASSSHYSSTTDPPVQGVPAAELIAGVDPVVVSAANAALSAVMPNNNQVNLIDRDLLIKILSDPKMIEQLIKNHGTATSTRQNLPANSAQIVATESTHSMVSTGGHGMPASKGYNLAPNSTHSMPATSMQNRPRPMTPGVCFSDPSTVPVGRVDRPLVHTNRAEHVAPPTAAPSLPPSGVFYPPPPGRIAPVQNPRPPVPEVIPAAPPQPVTKDINYYKSLIQQHGGDRHETVPQYGSRMNNNNNNNHLHPMREPASNGANISRDSKPKIMKACIYFNTSRGCRNGANCAYQHDESAATQPRVSGLPDTQSAKRMKIDWEITGT